MKKALSLLVAGSAIAVTLPAAAQAQERPDFTGFRLEAVGGLDSSRAGSDVDNEVNEDDDQSIEGLAYGIGAGYDFNAGGVVLGVEAELTTSTADVDVDEGDFEGFGFGNVEAGRDLYLGARIGATVGDNALIYAKGGYTNARYNIDATFDGDDFRQSIDLDGFRLGAGAEYAFGQGAFAKLEYRYSNYSDGEIDFERDDINDIDLGGEIDTDRHQVVVGVGFRF